MPRIATCSSTPGASATSGSSSPSSIPSSSPNPSGSENTRRSASGRSGRQHERDGAPRSQAPPHWPAGKATGDHARARTAAHHSGHVEERHDAARTATLVAVGDVPHLGVVGIHPLPHQPQSQQPTIELEIRIDVGSDRRDVVQPSSFIDVPHSCSIGANRYTYSTHALADREDHVDEAPPARRRSRAGPMYTGS